MSFPDRELTGLRTATRRKWPDASSLLQGSCLNRWSSLPTSKGKASRGKLEKEIGKTGTRDELNRTEEIFFLTFYILALSKDGFHV
jgi:hypothetical protein